MRGSIARRAAGPQVDHRFSADPAGGGFDLDLKVSAATGANKQTINGLELASRSATAKSALSQARGTVGQGVFSAERADRGDLRVRPRDAGALIRFADIYSRMEGGALDVTLSTSGGATAGTATIANFVLRDEPALSQLVAAAPAQARRPDRPDARRVPAHDDDLRAVPGRSRRPGRRDLQSQHGPDRGGPGQFPGERHGPLGDVHSGLCGQQHAEQDSDRRRTLLGGGSDEGLFGINYRVRGPIDAPNVSVNPLSAIAPGILRKILGVMDGSTLGGDAPDETTRRTSGRR